MGAFTCFNAGQSPLCEPASVRITFTNSWADPVVMETFDAKMTLGSAKRT